MSEKNVVIEKEGVSKDELSKILEDHTKKILEAVTPVEKTKSETEPINEPVPADYRQALVENLKKDHEDYDFRWDGSKESEEQCKKIVGETKVSDPKLQEAIGAVTATNAIPEIWAAEVERLSQYPESAFWNAPYITWKTDIKGKPGDTVNVITVAPVTCADFACDEPTTTAATIGKVPITLANKVCAYYMCKEDFEDVVPDTVDALNEGLARCLSVCIDNYFLAQALIGTNAGTLTEAGAMKGTVIAKAMGSMEAGNLTCWKALNMRTHNNEPIEVLYCGVWVFQEKSPVQTVGIPLLVHLAKVRVNVQNAKNILSLIVKLTANGLEIGEKTIQKKSCNIKLQPTSEINNCMIPSGKQEGINVIYVELSMNDWNSMKEMERNILKTLVTTLEIIRKTLFYYANFAMKPHIGQWQNLTWITTLLKKEFPNCVKPEPTNLLS